MNWQEFIEYRPPYQTAYFKGTNTRVLRIMLCLANSWTEDQILLMHPEIRFDHIDACSKYGAICLGENSDPQFDSKVIEALLAAQVQSPTNRPVFD